MSKTMALAQKKLLETMLVAFAEYENAARSERIKRGIQAKKAKKR